jgi:hypothetical protein
MVPQNSYKETAGILTSFLQNENFFSFSFYHRKGENTVYMKTDAAKLQM